MIVHLLFIILPSSIIGLVAILLCLAPNSGIAGESAETVTRAATAASYTTATGTVFLGFTADQWSIIGIVGGLILGVLTWAGNMLINWHFKSQRLKLDIMQAERGIPITSGSES